MIMGMIHAYKCLEKTKSDHEEHDFNDVDYLYLAELQRRNIEKSALISAEFPYVFLERNSSAHDQISLGMMNVFTLLDEQKQKGKNLNDADFQFLETSLVSELSNPDIHLDYDNFFVRSDKMKDLT